MAVADLDDLFAPEVNADPFPYFEWTCSPISPPLFRCGSLHR